MNFKFLCWPAATSTGLKSMFAACVKAQTVGVVCLLHYRLVNPESATDNYTRIRKHKIAFHFCG